VSISALTILFLAAFLACVVEMVEALTIVLAVGVVRGWRSPLLGVGAALAVLALIVAILGPALTLVPIDTLRLVVGALLLVFGLQWLRKAILRAGGYKALHDEDEAFQEGRAHAASAAPASRDGVDWYSFAVAFKGVLLEGLEVAFIVVTFGSTQRRLDVAVVAAALALVVVLAAGLVIRAPLARVPENTIKFVVGLLLTTFGVFWAGEGTGVSWPASDLALPVILAFLTVMAAVLSRWVRGQERRSQAGLA
jgi:uncharacterized membrane protein